MSLDPARCPKTVALPWRAWMLLGGALLAVMSAGTLQLRPRGSWFLVTELGIGVGVALGLAGAMLVLAQQRLARFGLGLALGPGRTPALLGVFALLALAFLASLWPLPSAYAWLASVVWVLCLAGAVWIGWRLAHSAAPLDFRRAQAALQRGELDEALALLGSIEGAHPDFPATYALQAMIQRQRRDFVAAYAACQRLLALRPDLYYGHAELGLTLLEEGKPAEAREPLRLASEIAPALAEGHFNLGMACAESGDQVGAVEALSRALRLGLRDQVTELIARYHLFLALKAVGCAQRAEQELRRLKRRSGVLRRWRADLSESTLSAAARHEELALVAAIERTLKSPRSARA